MGRSTLSLTLYLLANGDNRKNHMKLKHWQLRVAVTHRKGSFLPLGWVGEVSLLQAELGFPPHQNAGKS